MADKDAVLSAIARALRNAPMLSEIKGVHERELDTDGTDAHSAFPCIELQPISKIQVDEAISFVRYVRDDAGNEIGEIFEWVGGLRVQIAIWTIAGSGYDAVDISDDLELALFRYDERGYADLLPDGEGGGIAEINIRMEGGNPQSGDSLSGGASFLRRWHQDVYTTYTRRVSTLEQYGPLPFILDVDYPADGDYHGTDVEGRIQAEAPYAADGFGYDFGMTFGG